MLIRSSRTKVSQEIKEDTELNLSFPSICLKTCGLKIVLLYLHSAQELDPAKNLCRKDNWQTLETEPSVASFRTTL